MGRHDSEQRPPLGMRLTYELDVSETEIAKPAMDELGRGARGGATKVRPVDERDAEAGAGRLVRDARTDDAATDHEKVVGRPPKLRARRVALTRAHGHTGFVQALPPRASATSTRA